MKAPKKASETVNFTVTLEEANKIFKALGNLPFVEVYELIGKLNEQANGQLNKNENSQSYMSNGSSMDIDQFLAGKQ